MYHSIVLFSPSSNVNSGLHPTRSYALELSNALDNAPTGLEVSNLISFGCHPIILKINFATSVIVYLDPVPRFIGVQSVILSAALIVPLTISSTYVKSLSRSEEHT